MPGPAVTARSGNLPRCILNSTRLTRIQTARTNNTARWQALKAQADAGLAGASAWGNGQIDRVLHLGIAYQAGAGAQYGQKAHDILLNTITDPTFVPVWTTDSRYWTRNEFFNFGFGFDWTYALWSSSEKALIAKYLCDQMDDLWPETNPNQAGAWGMDSPANNYFMGFFTTWGAAQAVHGEAAGTGAAASGANRPEYFYQLMYSRWNSLMVPQLAILDGFFNESVNYDMTYTLGQILACHKTATGEDLINSNAYFDKSPKWRIYSTVDKDAKVHHGDQSGVTNALLDTRDRARGNVMMDCLSNATHKGWLKRWADWINVQNYNDWSEIVFHDESVTPVDYTATEPTNAYFPLTGIQIDFDNWNLNTGYTYDFCGLLDQAHDMHVNPNFLWYMGPSIGNGRMLCGCCQEWAGGALETMEQNGTIFGHYDSFNDNTGFVQSTVSAANSPNIGMKRREIASNYGYFSGQGKDNYNFKGVKVLDYSRKRIGLQNRTVQFLYSRRTPADPSGRRISFLGFCNATINGSKWVGDNVDFGPNYQANGAILAPASGVTTKREQANPGSSLPHLGPWRVINDTVGGAVTDYELVVMHALPSNQSETFAPTAIVASSGNADGGMFVNDIVMFARTESQTQPVIYDFHNVNATVHTLEGFEPNSTVALSVKDLDTNGVTNSNVTASGAGIVRFTVSALSAGNGRITLTPPPAAPDPPALQCLAGDTVNVLSIPNAVPGATSYNYKRGTAPGGPYPTVVHSGPELTFTDTGRTNGVPYYYVATSQNVNGESANSNEAQGTPHPPVAPDPPANARAVPGDGRVTVDGDLVAGALTYNLKRGITSGGEVVVQTGLLTPHFVDTGLTNGQIYYYEWTATNAAGTSGNSNEASAIPNPPGAAVRINCGGPAYTAQDGRVFGPDALFTNGDVFAPSGPPTITGTDDPTIYQTQRYNFPLGEKYTIPISNGSYMLTLHFAELFYHNAGQRVWSITANGQPFLTNYDAVARTGSIYAADQQSGQVDVVNGQVVISVVDVVDHGAINAIELVPIGTPTPPPDPPPPVETKPAVPTGLRATPGDGKITLNYNPNTELNLAGYNIYRSDSANGPFAKTNSAIVTGTVFVDINVIRGVRKYYQITAVDTSNNESDHTGTVSAVPGSHQNVKMPTRGKPTATLTTVTPE